MIRWNKLFCFEVLLFVGILAQPWPDTDLIEWTQQWSDGVYANSTVNGTIQTQEEWPPMEDGQKVPRLFPNITDQEISRLKTKSNLNNRNTNCERIYNDSSVRVYRCNVILPGFDAKNDKCDEVSSADEYGCTWFNHNVTLCHRWRDRYTQSITFCKSDKDTCSDLDARYMICACSVYFSWTLEQYYTFCDCKGPLADRYIDGCGFRYFGLLDSPTEERLCYPLCGRGSECRDCTTDAHLSSPGAATFCMCESADDLYGRREICPCNEQYHANSACSDEYELFSRECKDKPRVTTNKYESSTYSNAAETFSPNERIDPDGFTQTATTVNNTTSADSTTEYVDGRGTHSTLPRSRQTSSSPDETKTSLYPKSTQLESSSHSTTMNDKESTRSSRKPLLSDSDKASIIFGAIGLIVLIIVILLIIVLCVRLGNRGRRKGSTSEITPKADEFTEWRDGQQIQPNINGEPNPYSSSISAIGMSGRANGDGPTAPHDMDSARDDKDLYYQDYFQIIEQDGVHNDSENLYYFKIDNTPSGSLTRQAHNIKSVNGEEESAGTSTSKIECAQSGSNDVTKEIAKGPMASSSQCAFIFGDMCPIQPSTSAINKVDVCSDKVNNKPPTETEEGAHLCVVDDNATNQESPYFKLNEKLGDRGNNQQNLRNLKVERKGTNKGSSSKNSVKFNSMQTQESAEENPYYFKLESDDKPSTENCINKTDPRDQGSMSPTDNHDYLLLHKATSEGENNREHSTESDDFGPDDYQSLRFIKSQVTVAQNTDSENENDYFHLLKPKEAQNEFSDTNADYLSLQKSKPKQQDIPAQSQEDHDYFKLLKSEDYHRQLSNNSDTSASNIHLTAPINSLDGNDIENDDEPYMRLQKQSAVDGEHRENDYQLLRKKDDNQITFEEV